MRKKYKGYGGSRIGREFYVYRYTDKLTSQVVYIGKTNCSLKARVNAHKREEEFSPYDCDIDYVKLSNEVETDSVEKFLINKYKPCINLKDKVPFLTVEIDIGGLNWEPYEKYLKGLKTNLQTKKALKVHATKQSYVFDKVYEAFELGASKVRLPFVDVTLPTSGAGFNWCERDVSYIEGEYEFTVKKEAKSEFESRMYEILASIWMPIASSWDFSTQNSPKLAEIECAFEVLECLNKFAKLGFATADSCDMFECVLPARLASGVRYFEKHTEPAKVYGERIYLEWASDNHEHIGEAREEIYKDFVLLMRTEGVWGFEDNYEP